MRPRLRTSLRPSLLIVLLATMISAGSSAQPLLEPGISLTGGVTAQRESNALRLPDGVSPAQYGFDSDASSDTILSPYFIVDGLFEQGRQRVFGQLTFSRNRFSTFDRFDTDLLNFRLGWLWQLGNDWSGELSAAQDETNSDFDDFIGLSRNVLTLRSARAAANYRPRPDRRVSIFFDVFDGSNSVPARALNDFEIQATRIETGATTALGNELIFGYRYTTGLYPNRVVSTNFPIDNSYKQADADIGGRWTYGAFSRADFRIGYGWRRYDEISQRNFAGPVGRAFITWQATSKIQVEAGIVRDLGAVEDFDSLYSISTNLSAAVRYDFRTPWSVSASYLRRDISYAGDPGFLLGLQLPQREDVIDESRIALSWSPTPRWLLVLAQQRVARDSNRVQFQYTTNITQFTTQYRFGP